MGMQAATAGPHPAYWTLVRLATPLAVAALLAGGVLPRPAAAGRSEEKLASITKTTVYGGLLGGLLGLAAALIVEEDRRDDAVRWGVALGAFGGFAFGVVSREEEYDDLSRSLIERSLTAGTIPGSTGLGSAFRGRPGLPPTSLKPTALGYVTSRPLEVLHGCLEEEDREEEAGDQEAGEEAGARVGPDVEPGGARLPESAR